MKKIVIIICIALVLIVFFFVLFPIGTDTRKEQLERSVAGRMKYFHLKIKKYFVLEKKYPESINIMIEKGYLEKADKATLFDNWDGEIRYIYSKDGYKLISNGADKKMDTKDDIVLDSKNVDEFCKKYNLTGDR